MNDNLNSMFDLFSDIRGQSSDPFWQEYRNKPETDTLVKIIFGYTRRTGIFGQQTLYTIITHIKRPLCGVLVLMVLTISPESVLAEGFKNKDFLELPKIQQKGYLDGVMNTLSQVALQEKTEIGQCVANWYYGDKYAQRNGLILRSMKQYPDHTPPVIIIVLTERECGRYIRKE